MAIFFSDENQAAGESIAASLEVFWKERGRFPEGLRELQPKYLATIPKAGKAFGMVYAAEPGGTQCWLAYQVHRDSFQEYDCRQRTWLLTDYEETHAVKHPRGEWIRPSGRD